MQVLRAAVVEGGPTSAGIQRGLRAVRDVPTVLGPFSFDENRNATHPSWVRVVRGGRFRSTLVPDA